MTDTTPQDTPDVVAAALTDGATTLFVADFADTSTAWEAYEALKSVEDGRHVAIDGVIVVKRETDGDLVVQKATDHSTKRGLTWGLVGGATLGLLFPPSLLGSAAALGAGGAALGKARQLGIVAIVSDPAVLEIRRALERADAVVESALDDVVAKDIKALAKEAEKE